jgi:hypothetical protein
VATAWTCPHCDRAAFITDEHNVRVVEGVTYFPDAKDDRYGIRAQFTLCPNPACRQTSVTLGFGPAFMSEQGVVYTKPSAYRGYRLRPAAYARPVPEYVPAAIREDYLEACAIADLSPKASATLARRALQGMIRDFHGIRKPRLVEEIEALRPQVDPLVWKAIDAVRKVGNIGAHMEKDINVIVDVEPGEALQLIRLLEMLIQEWYVTRHRREQELAAIIAMAAEKEQERKPAAAVPAGQADDGAAPQAAPPLPEG